MYAVFIPENTVTFLFVFSRIVSHVHFSLHFLQLISLTAAFFYQNSWLLAPKHYFFKPNKTHSVLAKEATIKWNLCLVEPRLRNTSCPVPTKKVMCHFFFTRFWEKILTCINAADFFLILVLSLYIYNSTLLTIYYFFILNLWYRETHNVNQLLSYKMWRLFFLIE